MHWLKMCWFLTITAKECTDIWPCTDRNLLKVYWFLYSDHNINSEDYFKDNPHGNSFLIIEI